VNCRGGPSRCGKTAKLCGATTPGRTPPDCRRVGGVDPLPRRPPRPLPCPDLEPSAGLMVIRRIELRTCASGLRPETPSRWWRRGPAPGASPSRDQRPGHPAAGGKDAAHALGLPREVEAGCAEGKDADVDPQSAAAPGRLANEPGVAFLGQRADRDREAASVSVTQQRVSRRGLGRAALRPPIRGVGSAPPLAPRLQRLIGAQAALEPPSAKPGHGESGHRGHKPKTGRLIRGRAGDDDAPQSAVLPAIRCRSELDPRGLQTKSATVHTPPRRRPPTGQPVESPPERRPSP